MFNIVYISVKNKQVITLRAHGLIDCIATSALPSDIDSPDVVFAGAEQLIIFWILDN